MSQINEQTDVSSEMGAGLSAYQATSEAWMNYDSDIKLGKAGEFIGKGISSGPGKVAEGISIWEALQSDDPWHNTLKELEQIGGSVLAGGKAGYEVSKFTKNPWIIGTFVGIGSFLGEKGVEQLQNEIEDYLDNFQKREYTDFEKQYKECLLGLRGAAEEKGITPISADPETIADFINKANEFEQTYTIQPGDSLSKLADKYGVSLDDLIGANPWLIDDDRLSDDNKYALIKPGEEIDIPLDPNNPDNPFDYLGDANPFEFDPSDSWQFVPTDPLVLDTDKDGFISTTSVQESEVYFDLTGDGIKERTGWVKPQDAFLVYDKNKDGQIGGIDEVFGNENTEGFDELRDIIDSNYDNKIDKKDILFNRLQLWNDLNQDGAVQEGELRYLKDAGVTSIDLNAVKTDIDIEGNNISQASKYTDTQGEEHLVADVHLAYDSRLTTVDTSLIKDFTVDLQTINLPSIRGYGLVTETFVAYNQNDNLKSIALELANNPQKQHNEFQTFIDEWSGYGAYRKAVAQKYNLSSEIEMSDLDKKTWIMERFTGKRELSSQLESNYEAQVQKLKNTNATTAASIESNGAIDLLDGYINTHYNDMLYKTHALFAAQSVFSDVFGDDAYDIANDAMSVEDAQSLQQNIINFANSQYNALQNKTYLAKIVWMFNQTGMLETDVAAILDAVSDTYTKELLSQAFYKGVDFTGSYEADSLEVSGDVLTAGYRGDDIIQSHDKSDQTYLFQKGDGSDVIFDAGGNDTIIGGDGDDYIDGGTGADTMEGGNGNDTYIADNGDTIMDSDGNGSVYLSNEHLDGGEKETIKHIEVTTTNFTKTFIYCECETVTKWSDVETDEWVEEEEFYVDKATGTKYILNGSSLRVISSSGSITIKTSQTET